MTCMQAHKTRMSFEEVLIFASDGGAITGADSVGAKLNQRRWSEIATAKNQECERDDGGFGSQ